MDKQSEHRSEQEELKDIISSREDGFGHRLKIAREETKLSTLDVARELRLDEKIILALENEDHKRLPASAFVCGYIRNYAKFMNLQSEPLIEYYKKEISDDGLDPELKITKKKKVRKGINVSQFIVPVSMILVLSMVIFGGWKVWDSVTSKNVDTESSFFSDTLESINSIDSKSVQKENDSNSLALPVPVESSYEEPQEVLQQSDSDNDVITSSTMEEEKNPLETTDSVIVSTNIASEQEMVVTIDETPAASDNVPQASAESNLMPETDNRLFLEFTGNSWITIKDADNNKLSSGLKKSGETLELEGKRPYHIFLGDARVVTISIHGKVFDHAHFINDKNIARFNVE